MENSVYRIALEMHSNVAKQILNMKRRDTARQIQVTLTDGGKPYHIAEGCYALFTAKNPNGEPLLKECDILGDAVIYEVTEAVTHVAGELPCEIRLYDSGDKLITCPRFTIIVQDTVCSEDDEDSVQDNKDALTKLISDAMNAIDNANATAQEILDAKEAGEFKGEQGDPGSPGAPGKTPVNGVDYNTPEEKMALLEELQAKAGIKQTASGTALILPDSADCKLQAFTLDGGEGSVNINLVGKNLFDIRNIRSTIDVDGTSMNLAGGGSAWDIYSAVNGSTASVKPEDIEKLPYLPKGTYTIRYTRITDAGYLRVFSVSNNGSVKAITSGEGFGVAPQWAFNFELAEASRITIRRSNNGTMSAKDLQVEQGSIATDYEPFQNQTVTVEATGGKVDVLVQHPDLRSLYPTTVVSNDKNIPMSVNYVADTKAYVDNKFAELASAFISNV